MESSLVSVLSEIEAIVRDELDRDDVVLRPETTAKDVEGWDSLTNIRIMVAIERRFWIRFSVMEVTEIPNVGELVKVIEARA